MSTKIFPFLFVLLPFLGNAQSIEAKKETSRIEGKNVTGYQVDIQGVAKEADNSLAKYLKALGKTRQSGDYITVAEPLISGKKYDGMLYATTRTAGAKNAAWMAIVVSGADESAENDAVVKKLAHDFGVFSEGSKSRRKLTNRNVHWMQ
jgi:hypothetical protein